MVICIKGKGGKGNLLMVRGHNGNGPILKRLQAEKPKRLLRERAIFF